MRVDSGTVLRGRSCNIYGICQIP